jgi:hypothetical protein
LTEKGLNEEESKSLMLWIEKGKIGLSKFKAEKFGEIYLMGYTCKEISEMFPEYPYETILWARVQHDWDAMKARYLHEVQEKTLEAAMQARVESIRFLSDVLRATHAKWKKAILDYIVHPERDKPPEFLPKNIYNYKELITVLDQLMNPEKGKGNDLDPAQLASALFSVTINNGGESTTVRPKTVIDTGDVKQALKLEIQNKGPLDGT